MSDDGASGVERDDQVEKLREEVRRLEEAAEKLRVLADGVNEGLGRRLFQLFLQAVATYLVLGLVAYLIFRLVSAKGSKAGPRARAPWNYR